MSTFDDITSCCRELLLTFSEAKDTVAYLDKRLSPCAQEKFCFGYFPNNKNLPILSSVVSDEKLSELGIIYDRILQDGISTRIIRHATLEDHNLVLPYRDVYGNIVAIVGRTLLNEEERGNVSKYKNTSFDKGNHLFGLYEAKDSILKKDLAYIVEGQFDCITAHDKGMNNVVALGSSNMTFEQFALLNRYTNNIVLLLDNDAAGNAGAEKIILSYGRYANIKQKKLPGSNKDLDDTLKEYSVEELMYKLK